MNKMDFIIVEQVILASHSLNNKEYDVYFRNGK